MVGDESVIVVVNLILLGEDVPVSVTLWAADQSAMHKVTLVKSLPLHPGFFACAGA